MAKEPFLLSSVWLAKTNSVVSKEIQLRSIHSNTCPRYSIWQFHLRRSPSVFAFLSTMAPCTSGMLSRASSIRPSFLRKLSFPTAVLQTAPKISSARRHAKHKPRSLYCRRKLAVWWLIGTALFAPHQVSTSSFSSRTICCTQPASKRWSKWPSQTNASVWFLVRAIYSLSHL